MRILRALPAAILLLPSLASADSIPSLDELLSQTVSTASSSSQTALDAAASVTVITSEEIERFGYRNFADIFQWVRGFYLSYDRNYWYLGVRGFSRPTDYNDRVKLLIDGQQTNEPVFEMAYIGPEMSIDVGMIDRIEIVRGPGATLYGTGAMLAVVNVITKKGSGLDGVRVSGTLAEHDGREGAVAAGFRGDLGQMAVSARWGRTDGEDVTFPDLGTAEGLDARSGRGFTVSGSSGALSASGFFTSTNKHVPTAAYGTDFGDDRFETTDQVGGGQLSWAPELAPGVRLLARGYWDWFHYEGVYPATAASTYDDSDGRRWGAELQGQFDFSSSQRLTAGVEYRDATRATYRAEDQDGALYSAGNWPFTIKSVYAQQEAHFGSDLILTVGARWDDYSTAGSRVSPRAALVWHPKPDSSIKLLYGEGFRAPNAYETNYESESFGQVRAGRLDPETIRTFELVGESRLAGALLVEASVFRNDFRDLIDLAENDDGTYQFRNRGGARATGAEVGLTWRTGNDLLLRGSWTYQKAEDSDSGEWLTNSPKNVVRAAVSVPVARVGFASLEARWESGRRTVADTETDSAVVADLSLVSRELWDRLRIGLHARNLTDERFATPGGYEHAMSEIPQPGREVSLRVDVRF